MTRGQCQSVKVGWRYGFGVFHVGRWHAACCRRSCARACMSLTQHFKGRGRLQSVEGFQELPNARNPLGRTKIACMCCLVGLAHTHSHGKYSVGAVVPRIELASSHGHNEGSTNHAAMACPHAAPVAGGGRLCVPGIGARRAPQRNVHTCALSSSAMGPLEGWLTTPSSCNQEGRWVAGSAAEAKQGPGKAPTLVALIGGTQGCKEARTVIRQ